MKIKKNDMVKVISGGADKKGKVGKVLEVCVKSGRVKVEGVATLKRHLKPQRDPAHPEGGVVEKIGSVHISNVMLMLESQGRPVRTGISLDADGKKSRVVRGRNMKKET